MVGINGQRELVTLTQMVDEFEHFGDRFISAAVFSDDLCEVLALSRREVTDRDGRLDDALREVHPGQFEFVVGDDELPYTIQIRKPGGVELQRGHGLNSFEDKCPVPLLSVMKAEGLKGGLVHETFFLLKGPPIKNDGGSDMPRWCFLLRRRYGEWEAYSGGLLSWVKQVLWPEVGRRDEG